MADRTLKDRIYAEFVSQQQNSAEKVTFEKTASYHMAAAYGQTETKRLVEEMVREGILTSEDDETVSLTDWERYQYNF